MPESHQTPQRPLGDLEVAEQAAGAAAAVLLALRKREPAVADLRKQADAAAHDAIVQVLTELRPSDAVLSEEGSDDSGRLDAQRVWIVDPLDGTREYGEPGRYDWAVHVALWEQGELASAAVALPGRNTVMTTAGPFPTLPVPTPGARPRLAVSRSRPSPEVLALAESLDAELVPLGSAGYKTSAVVLGEVDAYVHTGGQYEWDSAAPVAVARAAGLHTSRADGSRLLYNRADPLLPDLVVCRPHLSAAILERLTLLRTE